MKFELLETQGSTAQHYCAGNVFLFILSSSWLCGKSTLCHRHRTDRTISDASMDSHLGAVVVREEESARGGGSLFLRTR